MRFPIFIIKLSLCVVLVISCFISFAQDAKYYFDKADTFYIKYTIKGNFDSAIAYYTKAISLDSNFALAYARRGFTYLTKKNGFETTITDCTKAISLMPDSAKLSECYYYRGEAYFKKEFYDSAIADYTKSLDHITSESKEIWDIYNGRFRAYFNTSQFESAKPDIDKVIELRPKFPGYYNNRGVCYNSMGQYQLAINDYLTSLVNKTHNSSGNAYFNIISPLVRLKRFDEAVLFSKLYFKNKSENNLSSFLYDGKDTVKYKFYRYFIKAVLQVSDNKLQDALASLDTSSKEYYSGIKEEQTRRLYVDILALNGYISEKLGGLEDARDNYNKALILVPPNQQPDIKAALEALDETEVVTRSNDKDGPVLDDDSIYVSTPKPIKANNDTRAFSIVSDSVKIRVDGKVEDESGILSVKVNSIAVTNLEKNGTFLTYITVDAGASTLKLTATDKKNNTSEKILNIPGTIAKPEQIQETDPGSLGKFYAILIAEKDYRDPNFDDLKYPVRDVEKLRNVLVKNYTFEEKNVDTLINRSREDILETIIARCKALGEKDNLMIFYAGHGDSTMDIERQPKGFLIPSTATRNKISNYITSEEISNAVFNSHTKHILVVLDACFSGAFIRKRSWNVDGDIIEQRKLSSRKVMTSGSLTPVPDKSIFIEAFTNFLLNNPEKKYVSTKDLWLQIQTTMDAENKKITEKNKNITDNRKKLKLLEPRYETINETGDKGGAFTFEKRIKQ